MIVTVINCAVLIHIVAGAGDDTRAATHKHKQTLTSPQRGAAPLDCRGAVCRCCGVSSNNRPREVGVARRLCEGGGRRDTLRYQSFKRYHRR